MEVFVAQLINGLATGALYAMLITGMNLLILVRQVTDHAYSHVMMISMAVGWVVMMETESIALGLVSIMLAAVIASVLCEPLFRPLTRRGSQLETVSMGMGIGMILTDLMSHYVNSGQQITFPSKLTRVAGTVSFGLISFALSDVITLAGCILVILALTYFLYRNKEGRALRAVAQSHPISQQLGIPFIKTGIIGFVISGVIAGIIGILCIFKMGTISSELGDAFAVKSLTMLLLAGRGNLRGGYIAALVLGVFEAMIMAYMPGRWAEAMFYGIIMLVILWRPNGVFGKKV